MFYSRSNYPKSKNKGSYPKSVYKKTNNVYKEADLPVYKNVVDPGTGAITKVATGSSNKGLKKTGEVNVYQRIQEASKGMSVYDILDRCSRGIIGDIGYNQSEFIDVAGYPKDILEAHQAVKTAEKEFDDIPQVLKDRFGNDAITFMKNFSLEKLQEFYKSMTSTKDIKEVKKDGE